MGPARMPLPCQLPRPKSRPSCPCRLHRIRRRALPDVAAAFPRNTARAHRLPAHEQREPREGDDDGVALADHLARASALFGPAGPRAALGDGERVLATGVYEPQRYTEYQRQVRY